MFGENMFKFYVIISEIKKIKYKKILNYSCYNINIIIFFWITNTEKFCTTYRNLYNFYKKLKTYTTLLNYI